jgi:hypothetical protein
MELSSGRVARANGLELAYDVIVLRSVQRFRVEIDTDRHDAGSSK